jgi:hypothetical protein
MRLLVGWRLHIPPKVAIRGSTACHSIPDDNDSKPANANKEGCGIKNKIKAASAVLGKKGTKAPVSRFVAFREKAHKYLFGWLDPK